MSLNFLRFSSLVLSGTIAVVVVVPSQAALNTQMNREQSQPQAQEQLQQYISTSSTVSARSRTSSSAPSRRTGR